MASTLFNTGLEKVMGAENYKAACEATHHALEMAEKRAGARLEEVWLAQSGGHLDAFYNEASVNVKSADVVEPEL